MKKLRATFQPRRDSSYGRVGNQDIAADGTVEIQDDVEAERLIKTGNFESADKKQAGKPDKKQAGNDPEAMVITNDEEEIDLAVTSHADLLTLAKEVGLEVKGNTGAKVLRELIFAHVNKKDE